MRRMFGTAAALVALVGCDDTVFPEHGGGGGEGGYPATSEGVEAYFADTCQGCHPVAGQGSGGINLPGTIFEDVSDEAESWVVPGDPDASRLWWVLTDGGPNGEVVPMPLGRSAPIDPARIQHIRLWIYDGAPL